MRIYTLFSLSCYDSAPHFRSQSINQSNCLITIRRRGLTIRGSSLMLPLFIARLSGLFPYETHLTTLQADPKESTRFSRAHEHEGRASLSRAAAPTWPQTTAP